MRAEFLGIHGDLNFTLFCAGNYDLANAVNLFEARADLLIYQREQFRAGEITAHGQAQHGQRGEIRLDQLRFFGVFRERGASRVDHALYLLQGDIGIRTHVEFENDDRGVFAVKGADMLELVERDDGIFNRLGDHRLDFLGTGTGPGGDDSHPRPIHRGQQVHGKPCIGDQANDGDRDKEHRDRGGALDREFRQRHCSITSRPCRVRVICEPCVKA